MTEQQKKKIWAERISENAWYIMLLIFAGSTVWFTLPAETLAKLGINRVAYDEFYGIGANLSVTCLSLVIFRLASVLMFPGWCLSEFRKHLSLEGKSKIMVAILLSIAFIIGSGMRAFSQEPPHLQIARQNLHVREKNGCNCGKEIDRWLKSVGVPSGSSYCAAFVSYCLSQAGATLPTVRSASARKFITPASIPISRIQVGDVKVGDLAVWQRGTGWQGHIGIVIRQLSRNRYIVLEANTSSGDRGSQANGDGVYIRDRTNIATAYFRITHFTKVTHAKLISTAYRSNSRV